MKKHSEQFTSLQNAHGAIPYSMTNDYMFRAVLQSNNKVLRGLICSLLHLSEKKVTSVEITNPILLGEAVTDKEFRLDINVVLNNHVLINLEMQIANKLNWQNRSIMYLCRSFDQLNHGQAYTEIKPVIHIGFLDYSLFEGHPEFYASYKLINVKNHQKYSDNLSLHVVDLSHIDLATDEDRKYHIHEWAMLFKAATWEEIKMLASKNEYLQEASETIFRMSADELVRKRCRDREEYYQDLRSYERKIELDRIEHEQDLRNYERVIAQNEAKRQQDRRNFEQTIAQNEAKRQQDRRNFEQTIAQNEAKRQQDRRSFEQKIELDRIEHEQAIAEKDALISQLLAENEALKQQLK